MQVSDEDIVRIARMLCERKNEITVRDIQGEICQFTRCNQYRDYLGILSRDGISGQRISQVLRFHPDFISQKLRGNRRVVWMMVSEKEVSV